MVGPSYTVVLLCLRLQICGFNQLQILWYCSIYGGKKSVFKCIHTVQTHIFKSQLYMQI